jgi:protein subunit release factor B
MREVYSKERTEGLRPRLTEKERVRVTRSKLEEHMSKERDEQAKIEAAKARLKGFIKPASSVNNHDPERMARYREGRENASRGVTWAELARNIWRW